jgi:hypothetical protein
VSECSSACGGCNSATTAQTAQLDGKVRLVTSISYYNISEVLSLFIAQVKSGQVQLLVTVSVVKRVV